MIEKVKKALRISHDKLDDVILLNIEAARAEMIRAGVDEDKIFEEDPLIQMAIITYCLAHNALDTVLAEGYEKSWTYQLDNLRKTPRYMVMNDAE